MMRAVTPHERSGFDGAAMSGPLIGILEALGQAQADQLGVKVNRAIEVADRDCNMADTVTLTVTSVSGVTRAAIW